MGTTPDFISITSDPVAAERTRRCCEEFNFQYKLLSSVDEYADLPTQEQDAPILVLDAHEIEEPNQIAGMIQIARQFGNHSFIVVVVQKKSSIESTQFMKKSGANLVLLENEFFQASKLEFVATQKIKAHLIPFKSSELVLGSTVDFTAFHMLPLNEKLLPVLSPGIEISESKLKKMLEVGELYIRRESLPLYTEYLQKNKDLSAQGLAARCRAQFLLLNAGFTELALLIADQSEAGSFASGKVLYDKILHYSKEMLISLGTIGDAYQIINNSSVGDFSSMSRSPAIAAYAGLISLMSDVGNSEDIMISALLPDIGMLEFPPHVTYHLKHQPYTTMHPEDQKIYCNHPIQSVNLCLSRKIPLSEKIKQIILSTHEQKDMKGFPHKIEPEKIPFESQLIQFCELLDHRCLVRMGQERKNPKTELKNIYSEELQSGHRLSPEFLQKIK